jgi:hypothetical protein
MHSQDEINIKKRNTSKRTVLFEKAPIWVSIIDFGIADSSWNLWYAQGETYRVVNNKNKDAFSTLIDIGIHYSELYTVVSHKNSVAGCFILKSHCTILK